MMVVPDEGTFSVRAEPAAAAKTTAATGPPRDGTRWLLPAGALLLLAVLALYVADLLTHLSYLTAMRDLVVYRDGGLIARHVAPAYNGHRASPLYDWTGPNGVQFTYPSFAAAVFAVASVLPWTVLRWAMTLASLTALGLSAWLTFGALGYRDRPKVRLGATFGVSALALLTEPVQQTLSLGQVNLLLMLLVVADLLTHQGGTPLFPGAKTSWWHGIGIGIAAGIKLTPLIFIPYLLLVRKFRQAATAAAVFAATVPLGYAILPRDSGHYWGGRLFLNANRIVFLGTRGNQSLRGAVIRLAGSVTAGTTPWIAAAALVVIVGLIAAAVLYRAGQPVPAMLACALTGLLVSPLTWDHHWVWVALGIALLAHLGAQARGRVRAAWWVAAAGLLAVFGAWPQFWDAQAGLTPAGLFWYGPATYFATGDKPWYHEFHWHGLQLIAGNIFVLAGLIALAALALSALRLWLRARNAGTRPAPGTSGGRPAAAPRPAPGTSGGRP
ncbi:MAG TPA: glycosyltransferase 87 family protein [Streptosporangiaceae bacterium]|nr:glycosyltransferase 87 family protein [Streptosporangiaceae bacterium]